MIVRTYITTTRDVDVINFETKIYSYKHTSNTIILDRVNAFYLDPLYTTRDKNQTDCIMFRGTTQKPEDVYRFGFIPKYDDPKDFSDSIVMTRSIYVGSLYGDIQMNLRHSSSAYVYAVIIDKETAANFYGQTLGFSYSRNPDGNNELGEIDLMEYRCSYIPPDKILAARQCNGDGSGVANDVIVNQLAYQKHMHRFTFFKNNDTQFAKFWSSENSPNAFYHEESRKGCLKKAPYVPTYY